MPQVNICATAFVIYALKYVDRCLSMWELIGFLGSYAVMIVLFVGWRREKRKREIQATPHILLPSTRRTSRASRRYQNSRLLESVSTESAPELSFQAFTDKFASLGELQLGLASAGFRHCELVLGVDFTASNEWQGRRTFNRHCLHTTLQRGGLNPYQRALGILGRALEAFSESGLVMAYGFGDAATRDRGVFPLSDDGLPCKGFAEVELRYSERARRTALGGPTTFAPLIRVAVDRLRAAPLYTVLLVLSDGQMGADADTVDALVEASEWPLSVIMVGVGDGPWHTMEDYDDQLPLRRFDNFQFVDFHRSLEAGGKRNAEAAFALHALMELPDQYAAVRRLGYIADRKEATQGIE